MTVSTFAARARTRWRSAARLCDHACMLRVRALAPVTVLALTATVACTAGEAPAQPQPPPRTEPAPPAAAGPAATKTEPAPVAAPAPEPATPPVVTGPLALGPDRYELPRTYEDCKQSEIFCGVHILDLASKKVTTLITRDMGVTWALRANKKETPVVVDMVTVPRDPRVVPHSLDLFAGAAPLADAAELPGAGLELWHPVAALAAGKAYVIARASSYDEIYLHEIEATGQHRVVKLGAGWPQLVYPYKEGVAVYTVAKRHSLDMYDPAAGKVSERLPIVSDVDKECAKLATETEPDRLMIFPEHGRAYVQFECVAIGE